MARELPSASSRSLHASTAEPNPSLRSVAAGTLFVLSSCMSSAPASHPPACHPLSVRLAPNFMARMPANLSPFFSHSCALFHALLHVRTAHLLCFQSFAHSCTAHPGCAPHRADLPLLPIGVTKGVAPLFAQFSMSLRASSRSKIPLALSSVRPARGSF